jgi:FixJ family two-component response regulator
MTQMVRAILRRSWYRQLWKKSTATVVVVDDDESMRRALKRQLRILGFNVVDFRSAEEFLTSELPIGDACMLLDVYMPEMNGIELCRHLASAGLHLPTVLMTGREDEETKRLMREAKPMATLFKPFDEVDLLRAIRKATSHRSKARP